MERLLKNSIITLCVALVCSCSATNRLSMTVTEPAVVALPQSVKRVGIINRSLPSEKREGIARVDAILSAEGLKLDEEGSRAAIQGLADRLRSSHRYKAVVVLEDLPDIRKGGLSMPAALERETLREICREHGLDAVFSLSYYDTATQVQANLGMMEVPNQFGVKVQVPAHRLDLRTGIRSGWRLYSPKIPLPLDQWEYTDWVRASGQGINPIEALETIANRKERVLDQSRRTGYVHGGRVEPSRVRVGRDYFVRGSEAFKRGRRLAQTGDWDRAAALWEREVTHPKDRIAGRAHYNMAIINEINGNLEAATAWARQAYADFGNREALRYLRVLERRLAQEAELQAQLTALSR